MSSRLHNKFHRHNHHTASVNDPRFPDASYDPIASYSSPFNGPLVVTNPTNGTQPPTVGTGVSNSTTIAIDAYGDINVTGTLNAAGGASINNLGQFVGDGSLLRNISTTSIVNLSGSPYQFGGSSPVTSTIPSFSGIGNLANAPYSTVAGGSANQITSNSNFSFIAGGSANIINGNTNTFVLGSNITTTLNNYTYVNNLSSLGNVYATVIGASAINAINFIGNGNGINLSTSSLSAATTSLVNVVSTTLNASITSLSATTTTLVNVVSTTLNSSITSLQSVYSTATSTTFNIKNLSATGFVNAVSANLGTTSTTAPLNVSPLTITGAANGSIFNQIQNTVAGVSASTDISLYNNDGVNYLDLGIASTTYNGNIYSPVFNVIRAGDSYIYSTSGNLAHGAADVNGNQTFFTGGTLSANERMRITNTGNVGIGTTVPNSRLTVVGDISASGNLYGNYNLPSSNLTVNGLTVTSNINAGASIVFSDTTTLSTAPIGSSVQSWQSFSSSQRVQGSTYTNTTGRPIQVAIYGVQAATNTVTFFINGVAMGAVYVAGGGTGYPSGWLIANHIIPNNANYKLGTGQQSIVWWELR
jgi:hypothetical protein